MDYELTWREDSDEYIGDTCCYYANCRSIRRTWCLVPYRRFSCSSVYGILRATIDADLVANLHLEQVRPLVKRLQADYYIDEDMIRDAIKRRRWNDILGVLKVQGTNLDMAYLRRWAANLSVTDLLERALIDAGLED